MALVKPASSVPMTITGVGSSRLDAALKPKMRNNALSPDRPGSKCSLKGTKHESINTTTATQRRKIICHVQSFFFCFGSKKSFHDCCVFTGYFRTTLPSEY